MYVAIGDMYDDFTISDRTVAGAPVGETNMSKMYDSAQSAVSKGLAMNGDLRPTLLAMSARVKHAKGVWAKLNPVPANPTNPLVSDNGYAADAAAALAAGFTSHDVLVTSVNQGNPPFGFELNNRVEITTSPYFVTLGPTNKPTSIILKDIVEANKQEPFSTENILLTNMATCSATACSYAGDPNLPPIRVVSDNEMRLLIAEAKLAAGDNAGFDAAINTFRAAKGLAPAYVGGVLQGTSGLSRSDVLQFERRVALLFMGRRWNDMYRWKVVDANWNANSTSVKQPGCLFPIGFSERESNDLLNGVKGTKYVGLCK
ncbi:MAG: RagB/SusD family nutrient uptake outer membrane protein [Gemmatimonadaceae bacterium]